MGKAQSKRSVDITTEVNKDGAAVDEGTGKMGKIEDVDQLKPRLNGDANHKDGDVSTKISTTKSASIISQINGRKICGSKFAGW